MSIQSSTTPDSNNVFYFIFAGGLMTTQHWMQAMVAFNFSGDPNQYC